MFVTAVAGKFNSLIVTQLGIRQQHSKPPQKKQV